MRYHTGGLKGYLLRFGAALSILTGVIFSPLLNIIFSGKEVYPYGFPRVTISGIAGLNAKVYGRKRDLIWERLINLLLMDTKHCEKAATVASKLIIRGFYYDKF